MKEKLVIVGAGGLGREVAAVILNYLADDFELLGFVDDGCVGEEINGLPVLGGVEWLQQQEATLNVVLAIGQPATRKAIVSKLGERSFVYPNIMHPNYRCHAPGNIRLGQGNIMSDTCILTTDIEIGSFNLINLSCTIGHDTVIGNYCSVMPGVNISGGAQLGDLVYVGTGAKLIKATSLGEGSTVGAGAVVNSDIPAGKTYVGIPAKEIN